MSQENSFMSEDNNFISEDNNLISEDDNFISEEKNYKDLGKWLWIIFWMTIAATVITLLLDNSIAAKYIPGNEMIDNIFGLVFLLARSVIIYKLYTVNKKYQLSGVLGIISVIMISVERFAFSDGSKAWSLLVTVPALVIYAISGIIEMKAHSLVLKDVNDKMSKRWNILSYLYLGSVITFIVGVLIVWILYLTTNSSGFSLNILQNVTDVYLTIMWIALILLAVGTFVIVIVGIMQIIYLFLTAKFLRKNYNMT